VTSPRFEERIAGVAARRCQPRPHGLSASLPLPRGHPRTSISSRNRALLRRLKVWEAADNASRYLPQYEALEGIASVAIDTIVGDRLEPQGRERAAGEYCRATANRGPEDGNYLRRR